MTSVSAALTGDTTPLAPAESIPLIFKASISEMVRRRIVVFLILICCLPILVTVIWRAFGQELAASVYFTNMVSTLYLQLLVYIVGLAFGIPTVHSEVQGRTITYLFTRPIPKWHIYTGKLLAVQVVAGGLLAASLIVCFMIVVVGNAEVLNFEFVKAYVNHVFLVLVATVCVTAVCAIFGTAFSKPVVWGMLYSFGWELVVSKFPSKLATWTINFHVRNLFLDTEDIEASVMDVFRMLLTSNLEVSSGESTLALGLFLVAAIALGSWVFRRKEYVIS